MISLLALLACESDDVIDPSIQLCISSILVRGRFKKSRQLMKISKLPTLINSNMLLHVRESLRFF